MLTTEHKQQLDVITTKCINQYGVIINSIEEDNHTYIRITLPQYRDAPMVASLFDMVYSQDHSSLWHVTRYLSIDDHSFAQRISEMKEHCQELSIVYDANKSFRGKDQLNSAIYRKTEIRQILDNYHDAKSARVSFRDELHAKWACQDPLMRDIVPILKSKKLGRNWTAFVRSEQFPNAGKIQNVFHFVFRKNMRYSKSALTHSAVDHDLVMIELSGYLYKSFKNEMKKNHIPFAKGKVLRENRGYSKKAARKWRQTYIKGDGCPCTDKQMHEHVARNFKLKGFDYSEKQLKIQKSKTIRIWVKKIDLPTVKQLKTNLTFNFALSKTVAHEDPIHLTISEQQLKHLLEMASRECISIAVGKQYENGITISFSPFDEKKICSFLDKELMNQGLDTVIKAVPKDTETNKHRFQQFDIKGKQHKIEWNNPNHLARFNETLQQSRASEIEL